MSDENESESEESSTDEELKRIYQLAGEQTKRLADLARELSGAHPELARAIREIGGSILPVLQDLTACIGAEVTETDEVLSDILERLDDDGATDRLSEDEGQKFLALFQGYLEMLKNLSEDPTCTATQREMLDKMRALTEDRVSFVREIAGIETEEPETAESEPKVGNA